MSKNKLFNSFELIDSIERKKTEGTNPGAWCKGKDGQEYLIKLLWSDDCREVIRELMANRFHSSQLSGNISVPAMDLVKFEPDPQGQALYRSIMRGWLDPEIDLDQVTPHTFLDSSQVAIASAKIDCAMIDKDVVHIIDEKETLPEKMVYEGQEYHIPELGKIAAMARVLGDRDWLGGSGGNLGFIKYPGDGDSVKLVAIDTGLSFPELGTDSELAEHEADLRSRDFRYSNQGKKDAIKFDHLSEDIKSEFLTTLSRLYLLNTEEIKAILTANGKLTPIINAILGQSVKPDIRAQASTYVDDKIKFICENLQKLVMTYIADIKAIPELWGMLQAQFLDVAKGIASSLPGYAEVYFMMQLSDYNDQLSDCETEDKLYSKLGEICKLDAFKSLTSDQQNEMISSLLDFILNKIKELKNKAKELEAPIRMTLDEFVKAEGRDEKKQSSAILTETLSFQQAKLQILESKLGMFIEELLNCQDEKSLEEKINEIREKPDFQGIQSNDRLNQVFNEFCTERKVYFTRSGPSSP